MLANTNILRVHHGEKPGDPCSDDRSDGPGLSVAGEARLPFIKDKHYDDLVKRLQSDAYDALRRH